MEPGHGGAGFRTCHAPLSAHRAAGRGLGGSSTARLSGLADDARLEILVADANRSAGIRHSFFGHPSSQGIVAMNPGVAFGKLGIIEGVDDKQTIDASRIYVIPETLSDLEPMAGILTLDSGNALSHSQLLAANLGIPNATIPSSLLPVLREHAGRELFFAVTRSGVVVLNEKANMPAAEIQRWNGHDQEGRFHR
jgi:hypothetical protein